MAAQIAQCVFDQGNEQFWRFHDALYTQVSASFQTSADELIEVAGQFDVDVPALRECYESGTHRATVSYDERRARDLGLRGTPSLFINNEQVFSYRFETLRDRIQQELGAS